MYGLLVKKEIVRMGKTDMFNVDNGKYRILETNLEGPLQFVRAELIVPPPRICPIQKKKECRYAAVYSQAEEEGIRHQLYGLYDEKTRKPTEFYIFRKRYQCQACESTFFADYDDADFGEKEHALPEFIKYLIKEWLKDENCSFTSLGEKYSHSKSTISNWHKQLVEAFDSKTKCNTRPVMYFSSFRYGKKNPEVHCGIYTIIREKPVLCGIIDNYTDVYNLENEIRERLGRLSVAEEVIYDYYPGVNKVMKQVFPNAKIIIDNDGLYDELSIRTAGIEKRYKSNMAQLVYSQLGKSAVTYEEWFAHFGKWINTLPEQNKKEVEDFYFPLMKETPEHIVNTWQVHPTHSFNGLTQEIEERGISVPYESLKLRLLYESSLYAEKVEKCLSNLEVKAGKKKKGEDVLLATIRNYMAWTDTTAPIDTEPVTELCMIPTPNRSLMGVKEISNQTIRNNETHERKKYVIDFFEAFPYLDPNKMFDLMPIIRDWHIPLEWVYETLDDKDNDEWAELDDI